MRQRKAYYEALEQAQRGPIDITPWLLWFLEALRNALLYSLQTTDKVLRVLDNSIENIMERFQKN